MQKLHVNIKKLHVNILKFRRWDYCGADELIFEFLDQTEMEGFM